MFQRLWEARQRPGRHQKPRGRNHQGGVLPPRKPGADAGADAFIAHRRVSKHVVFGDSLLHAIKSMIRQDRHEIDPGGLSPRTIAYLLHPYARISCDNSLTLAASSLAFFAVALFP